MSSSSILQELGLVPLPQQVIVDEHAAPLLIPTQNAAPLRITYSAGLDSFSANQLADAFKSKNISAVIAPHDTSAEPLAQGPTIHLALFASSEAALGNEGYELHIDAAAVNIRANTAHGVFYGVQTLKQIIFATAETNGALRIPNMKIIDKPLFAWRGMHLDVSRHFASKSFVLKYIELLALHKFNQFHWHLTDDQGWRVEIKRFPRLTEVGAWREHTAIRRNEDGTLGYDGMKHGGFYTHEEIREVVAFAKAHFVTVVPEIELPGHAQAAIASYPELGCTSEQVSVKCDWGISPYIYNVEDSTFEFLQQVLDEVLELFPSEYIHIGGDEAIKKQWKSSPRIQERMIELKIKSEEKLQSYFVKRIEAYLTKKGRKLIGWDEILEGGLAEGASVMSWRGIKGGKQAAMRGHTVVMTPNTHCYFDYYQGDKKKEPKAIGGFIPLSKAYEFDPLADLTEQEQSFVLGGQGNVWTEYMPNEKHVEYMTFPRACAMAEVLWTPKQSQNFDDFQARLKVHLKQLDKLDVNYRKLD